MHPFKGSFTQQEPISDDAIASAIAVLKSGRLHRYNTAMGELSEVSLFEQEFAAYQGSKYCLACASGGYALTTALRATGIQPEEPVLTNAFSLAPVPGAIIAAGGKPILIDMTNTLVLDLGDLEKKIQSSHACYLVLSHMRGHIVNMESLLKILNKYNITLIEDCAHTMGAMWNQCKSGNFGLAGCFSVQTYKHINSGEGGLITSDDPEFMARCIVLSGSYMLYERHGAAPSAETFVSIRLETPNCSGRMDNLRASILRPQLSSLDKSISRWNHRYHTIEQILRTCELIFVATRPPKNIMLVALFNFKFPLCYLVR